MASHHATSDDPCKEFGPTQKWALVWFFSVILIGCAVVYNFARIDRFMYDSNAEYYNYQSYHENRLSQSTIRGDSVDPRSHGDSVSVVRRGASGGLAHSGEAARHETEGGHGE